MRPAAERAAEQHMDDLTDRLVETRQRHGITRYILGQRLRISAETIRRCEVGLYPTLPLTEFAAWSRALGLTMHLTDQYGRVVPAWSPHRLPHETESAFEARRLTRTLDLRRDAIPCDLPVLTAHLGVTATAWQHWNDGTNVPDLRAITRACIALDVRVTLIPLWHERTLTDVRAMQAESNGPSPQPARRSDQQPTPTE